MNNRRWRIVMVGLVIGMLAAACGDDSDGVAGSTTVSASSSSTSVPSSTPTTVPVSITTTRAAVPGVVDVVTAGPGGGSGEIKLRWNAVANVTGYRVLRASAAIGPFSVNADIDTTTGKATAGSDVTNIWSQQRSYVPSGATTAMPDSSPWFEYVEVISGGAAPRYFRVVAYNANGEAPASAIVCGSPTGSPRC
jgi:hypothetical protein